MRRLPLELACCGFLLVGLLPAAWGHAEPAGGLAEEDSAQSAEEQREQLIAQRFLAVLEKNPRRGTALDRVYSFHAERGTLDKWIEGYQRQTAEHPDNAVAWMMLGLIEAQRGRDAAAVAAFRQAETRQPDNPLASFYLGQSLVFVGQPDQAAQAFERALTRHPARSDMLDIYSALGRVYQRAQRHEEALAAWKRFEQAFPDDLRVQEQIAAALEEEGQWSAARERFEKLAASTPDAYRQTMFRLAAAQLRVRLGQTPQALTEFQALAAKLNPDSWLAREVDRKIEDVFLRNEDQAGLAKYYEAWLEKHADDIRAMDRLARVLIRLGRAPEAERWLERALKLAPSQKALRLAYIEQLVYEQKFPQAIAQHEALDKTDPGNPDHLRDWGKLILRDASRPLPERRKAAARVWRRLADARPKDPVIATQMADLYRQAEMTAEALAEYQRAVSLAPEAVQYREYLGEYLHVLHRAPEALETWRGMATESRRTAPNLTRLAEVLLSFGYRDEALAALNDAVKLAPDDFNLRMKSAQALRAAERYPAGLEQLDRAGRLAENTTEREAVLDERIQNYQAAGRLEAEIESLDRELQAGRDVSAQRWYRLARYTEAARQLPAAAAAIRKALALDPRGLTSLAAQARIDEAQGNLASAADAYRQLATLDRRLRTEYLTNVARLEARLGRRDQALEAGRALLASAPGNIENYEFFAELCFGLGARDEAFDVLRRGVRANPNQPKALLSLAGALAERFQTEEAIELYWRAFTAGAELDPKLSIVTQLAELYLRTDHFDRLLERLGRLKQEAGREREITLCMAQAYQAAGDYGSARDTLERLLVENTADTQLLQQLANLAEAEGDPATAAKYQQQLVQHAPGVEHQTRLAQLLLASGQTAEAAQMLVKLAAQESDPVHTIRMVDSLLAHGKADAALTITQRLLRLEPDNWDLLYREGVALAATKPAESEQRFRALLALRRPDDEPSRTVRARRTKPGRAASGRNRQTGPIDAMQTRRQAAYYVTILAGLRNRDYYYGGQPPAWTPEDFGAARLASLGWLLAAAEQRRQGPEFVQREQAARDKAPQDPRRLWDWLYLAILRTDAPATYQAAKALSYRGDLAGQWYYLSTLGQRVARPDGLSSDEIKRRESALPPLPPAELDHVVDCYRAVAKQSPNVQLLSEVLAELKRAGRKQQESELYRQALAAATKPEEILATIVLACERDDAAETFKLLDRYRPAAGDWAATFGNSYGELSQSLAKLMNERAKAGAHGDVLQIFDRFLAVALANYQPGKTSRSRSSGAMQGPMYVIQITGSGRTRYMQIDFPTPGDHFPAGCISLLRNEFEMFRRDDLMSDLFAHFSRKIEAAPAAERVPWLLARGYLNYWNEKREQAAGDLAAASDAVPDDSKLKFDLVRLYEKTGNREGALRVLSSMAVVDQNALKQKELAVLRLAVLAGDIAAARQSAERLFGLRLDADTELQLAAQMRQLGLHELAESVLSRARRQAGNRVETLVTLMLEYQQSDRLEPALEIALQILRRSAASASRGAAGFARPGNDNSAARSQAIQVLLRSGKLPEMIARAEKQLAAAPSSVQIVQTLAEYYQAAGDKAKARQTSLKLVALKPDDANLRYQTADSLMRSKETVLALEHYRQAIKLDPSLLNRHIYQLQQVFLKNNRADELVKIVDDLDVKHLRDYRNAGNMVVSLLQDRRSTPAGLRLFRRLWEAFPTQRLQLLRYLQLEKLRELPGVFDDLCQVVMPTDAASASDAWDGIGSVLGYRGSGKIETPLTMLVEAARQQNRLPSLAERVDKALKQFPTWQPGYAIQAVILAGQHKPDEAARVLRRLLDDKQSPMTSAARWALAQQLESQKKLEPLVIELYQSAQAQSDAQIEDNFEYSPGRRLVSLYAKTGRKAEARKLVLDFEQRREEDDQNPGYAAYQLTQKRNSMAAELLTLGYPIDAARLFNLVVTDKATIESALSVFGGQDYLTSTARQGLQRSLRLVATEDVRASVRALLEPVEAGGPIDLVLLIEKQPGSHDKLESVAARAVVAACKSPEATRELSARLTERATKSPDDFVPPILATLLALGQDNAQQVASALASLEQLVDRLPLEAIARGERPNARQRADAARQIGLWLVARECGKQPKLRATAAKLGTRAIEAASRQASTDFAIALLGERADERFAQHDAAAAGRDITQMLDLLLPQHDTKSASAASPGKADPSKGKPIAAAVTNDQFERIAAVADLAADRGLVTLSLEAVRRALGGGPPVDPISITAGAQGQFQMMNSRRQSLTTDGQGRVAPHLERVDQAWDRHEAPAAEVYRTLAAVVLPAARDGEIFLYARDFRMVDGLDGTSAGRLLARWCARAGAAADLKAQIALRQARPLASMPARLLLVQLALATDDRPLLVETLAWLQAAIKTDASQHTAQCVCQALLPALANDAAGPRVAEILEIAVDRLPSAPPLSDNEGFFEDPRLMLAPDAAGPVLLALAKYRMEHADVAAGRKHLDRYLARLNTGVDGNPGLTAARRQQGFQTVAEALLGGGQLVPALALLGRYADTVGVSKAQPGLASSTAFLTAARQMAAKPVKERYQELRTLVLPTDKRKSVRFLACFVGPANIPAAFAIQPSVAPQGIVDSARMLIDAARELGQLESLAAELQAATTQKIENALPMWLLVRLAQDQAQQIKPQLKQYLDEVRPANPPKDAPRAEPRVLSWPEFLLLTACLRAEPLRPLTGPWVRQVLDQTGRWQDWSVGAHLRQQRAAVTALRNRQPPTDSRSGGLQLWRPAGQPRAQDDRYPASWWVAAEGHVCHVTGPRHDYLEFAYPLSGTFTFSVEAWDGGSAESHVSFAGREFKSSDYNPAAGNWVPGIGGRSAYQDEFARGNDFNRLKVESTPGRVRFYLNDHLFYTEQNPSPTSPWLALYAEGYRQTTFRNFTLTGSPQIPREVPLAHADRLEGWVGDFYDESVAAAVSMQFDDDEYRPGPSKPFEPAWKARDGVIHGRRVPVSLVSGAQPSRLYYRHSLADGDSVRGEFYYEPGRTVVHPALGRLAFLLVPEGVRVHWMADKTDLAAGLATTNSTDEPACRRGKQPLPLKPGQWNTFKLSLEHDSVLLELNGELIYERPLEPDMERTFGLFHYEDQTEARARNLVLAGNWPTTLTAEQLADPLVRLQPRLSSRERHLNLMLVEEPTLARAAESVLRSTAGLPAEERYRQLAAWVMPQDWRAGFRLYGTFTPTDPPPIGSSAATAVAGNVSPGRRLHSGAVLEAPALELVALAGKLGRLDELARQTREFTTKANPQQRARQALLVLIAQAQGRNEDLAQGLKTLGDLYRQAPPKEGDFQRWPELLVAARTAADPALRDPCTALLKAMSADARRRGLRLPFDQRVLHLQAWAALAAQDPSTPPWGNDPGLEYWSPVSYTSGWLRGSGQALPFWTVERGEVRHRPGHGEDHLYFTVPLRGNFEVRCEMPHAGYEETSLAYGGMRVGIDHNLKGADVEVLGQWRKNPLDPPLVVGPWYRYRLAVQDGSFRVFIDDKKIFEERLPAEPNPWLSIRQQSFRFGGLRNLQISGSPQVPAKLNLLASRKLSGWSADYFQESIVDAASLDDELEVESLQDNGPTYRSGWAASDDGLVGFAWRRAADRQRESLLRYQRPMLEDGEISYEFYYEPAKSAVHPALDRLAMLIEPDGVRVHWLTDGVYERSGLAADNVQTEPEHRRGPARLPLKAGDWNRMQLSIAGDTLALRLNDVEIYRRPIEPTNQRVFGLFHYADQTTARVRSVVYRGDWPRSLPPADQLWVKAQPPAAGGK
jgi:tetratricopeptide (TPR) repeat protein